jgi:hypothetical protein
MRLCQNPKCGREFHPNVDSQLYCNIFCKQRAYDLRRRARAHEQVISGNYAPRTNFVPPASRPMEQVMPSLTRKPESVFASLTGQDEAEAILRDVGMAPDRVGTVSASEEDISKDPDNASNKEA